MKTCAVTLIFLAGTALAQEIPQRNCLSDPFMKGCPAEEQAQKIREQTEKWKDLKPEQLGIHPPTAQKQGSVQPQPRPPVQARVAVVDDNDWKRPRLTKPLAPDWPRWTFAPSDSSMVVGMKLQALLQSPILRNILGADAWKKAQAAAPPVTEVWLWVRVATARQPDTVMLLIGSGLDTIGADLRSQGGTVCFLDGQTMLVGDYDAVNESLQGVITSQPVKFAQRASELWAKNDMWVIANRQMLKGLLPANTGLTGISGLSMGMTFQDKLTADRSDTGCQGAIGSRISEESQPVKTGRRQDRTDRKRRQRSCRVGSRTAPVRNATADHGIYRPDDGDARS